MSFGVRNHGLFLHEGAELSSAGSVTEVTVTSPSLSNIIVQH